MKKFKLVIMLIVTIFFTQSAQAFLLGKTIRGVYLFPSQDILYQDLGTIEAGSGIPFYNLGGLPNLDLYITDNQIIADYINIDQQYNGRHWHGIDHGYSFNGFLIYDNNDTLPDITSVTIDFTTHYPGFDQSCISFDANKIWVDWKDTYIYSSNKLVLNINSPTNTVPEPSTFLLLGAGICGLALLRRKTRK